MATPRSLADAIYARQSPEERARTDERLATKARIEALTAKARAFDTEHAAIVALQDTDEYVQPRVLCKMLAYSVRMRAFEAELAALDAEDINALVAALGFPDPQ